MPRLIFCLAAKGVVRDADTGTMTVYSILEELGAEGFPFFVQEVAVLALWARDAGEGPVIDVAFRVRNNLRVLTPQALPVRIDFADKNLHRSVVRVGGLVVAEPGALEFEFLRDELVIASYSVHITTPRPVAEAVGAQNNNPA